jgi:hypothetical protein
MKNLFKLYLLVLLIGLISAIILTFIDVIGGMK